MKKLIECADEGFQAVLGEDIAVWCVNYIYAGKLVGVNDEFIKLEDARVVYETGDLQQRGWKDAQPLPGDCWYIRTAAIESWGFAS